MRSLRSLICLAAAGLALGLGQAAAIPSGALQHTADSSAISSSIMEASGRFAIPANWIRAVISVESSGNARALSPKGAMGLMQIMPATWRQLQLRYMLGNDPYDIHDNILAGTALLRELYDRFGAAGFLAAYNAGPTRYLSFLTANVPLKEETQVYLQRLSALLAGQPDLNIFSEIGPRNWRSAGLFASNGPISAAHTVDLHSSRNPDAAREQPLEPASRLAPTTKGLFVAISAAASP